MNTDYQEFKNDLGPRYTSLKRHISFHLQYQLKVLPLNSETGTFCRKGGMTDTIVNQTP